MVCNSGAGLAPSVDGKMHHFNNVGLYDGLFVLQDTESKTLWNHITGEALYGPKVGQSLGPIRNLLQTNTQSALAADPSTRIAISERPYFVPGKSGGPAAPRNNLSPEAKLQEFFVKTIAAEDTRRPRMELGLGLWSRTSSRYYPLSFIREKGRAFIDHFDGRTLLIYIDPDTNAPAASFVKASTAEIKDGTIHLDTGAVLKAGVLSNKKGKPQRTELPQQIFTRWYGFALTFPSCEVASASP